MLCKELVDGLNLIDKRYIYQLMTNVQLPGSKRFEYQMQIHIITQNNDVIFYEEFQQRLSKKHSQKWYH